MPTSHAAVRHAVSWGTARRAERAFLDAWDRTRPKRRPCHLGVDEIQRGKGQHFWTVLSDLVRGEVIGLQKDHSEDSLRALLHDRLDARQRAAVEAVCTDMHRPYLNVVAEVLTRAEVIFDKFHVLQHASAALDDVRRQEFFRAGSVLRKHGRGKRWLLLRRWKTVRGSKRAELQALFAANRRLFKAYVLLKQLDRLWMYKTQPGVLNFLNGWIDALRWQRLPEMERLGDFLFKHVEGIAAYCTIRSVSGSSNRSTQPLRPSSVGPAACETKPCWCSRSNGRPHARSDPRVMLCVFFIQRECIHFGEDRIFSRVRAGPIATFLLGFFKHGSRAHPIMQESLKS